MDLSNEVYGLILTAQLQSDPVERWLDNID